MRLEKPKPQLSVNFDPKKISTYYSLFKIKSNKTTQEEEQKDSEIEAGITGVFYYRKFECIN